MISSPESRKDTPQDFILDMYSGLKTRSHTLSGIGVPPSAALTLSTLMPTVVKPHIQSTTYWLPGSILASCAATAGSTFFRFGILDLSSFWNRSPWICMRAQFEDGTTTSYPVLPA